LYAVAIAIYLGWYTILSTDVRRITRSRLSEMWVVLMSAWFARLAERRGRVNAEARSDDGIDTSKGQFTGLSIYTY